MTAFHIVYGRFKAWNPSDGTPLAGGKLYWYEAGTTTPQTTWADQAKASANAHPVVLDAAGEAPVFLDGDYKLEIRTAADVLVYTQDGINSPPEIPDLAPLVNAALEMPLYATQAALALATVGSTVKRVRCLGYDDPKDSGGAEFRRVASVPAHTMRVRSTDRYLPSGAEDALNGGWWEIGEAIQTPLQIGAVGDGVTDDNTALNAINDLALPGDMADLAGRDYHFNGTFTPARQFRNGRVLHDGGTLDFYALAGATGAGLVTITSGSGSVEIDVPIASQAQAEAGTDNATALTPLRGKQLLDELGLPDAPEDGATYARKDGGWVDLGGDTAAVPGSFSGYAYAPVGGPAQPSSYNGTGGASAYYLTQIVFAPAGGMTLPPTVVNLGSGSPGLVGTGYLYKLGADGNFAQVTGTSPTIAAGTWFIGIVMQETP